MLRVLQVVSCLGMFLMFPARGADVPADVVPVPLQRINPDYPARALRQGLSGWVRISFVITPDGDVTDAIVVKSSDVLFESYSLDAVSKWKYDGSNLGPRGGSFETIIRFGMGNMAGVSEDFLKVYQDAEPLLNNGKLDEVEEVLKELDADARSLLDIALVHWLGFRYFIARGDKLAAIDELSQVLMRTEELPADLLVWAMDSYIRLSLERGSLRSASYYIRWLRENPTAAPNYGAVMQQLSDVERAIETTLASTDPVVIAGRHFRKYWFHELSHSEFAIGEVNGDLKGLQVRCRNTASQQLEIQLDSGYRLPATWKDCTVYVEAEPGTTFTLTEFPPEPASAPAP